MLTNFNSLTTMLLSSSLTTTSRDSALTFNWFQASLYIYIYILYIYILWGRKVWIQLFSLHLWVNSKSGQGSITFGVANVQEKLRLKTFWTPLYCHILLVTNGLINTHNTRTRTRARTQTHLHNSHTHIYGSKQGN